MAAAAAPFISAYGDLPPYLTSASEPPALFDGTSRLLYLAYHCPYAQRAWIARNYKALHDKIKIVAIDLADRPAWYKEKFYPENKVKGESLDLLKYIDSNFDGPAMLPDDSSKKQFAEELLAYSDGFNSAAFFSWMFSKGDVSEEAVAALDKIEAALGKYSDGPFFLGQFSLVDIAYVPFIDRLQTATSGMKNYDVTKGRPNLHKFIEDWFPSHLNLDPHVEYHNTTPSPHEICTQTAIDPSLNQAKLSFKGIVASAESPHYQEANNIDAYTQTKQDQQLVLDQIKERFGIP